MLITAAFRNGVMFDTVLLLLLLKRLRYFLYCICYCSLPDYINTVTGCICVDQEVYY